METKHSNFHTDIMQEVTSGKKMLQSLKIISDHLPFLACSGFFRITTIALLLTYLNTFALAPVALYWLSCVAIGYRRCKAFLFMPLRAY